VRVHGRLHIETRNRNIDRFLSDPKAEVMVATPAAAKEGLTLTVANNVIFYDRSFSLDDYLQAQDRVHRISQTRTCMVHNLIMGDSIDEWVESLLHAKHVAAQLTQGDISLAHYQSTMAYDFGDILRGVLGIQSAQGRNDDGQASLG
jgi:SNF2 family DNA or RNA helicase